MRNYTVIFLSYNCTQINWNSFYINMYIFTRWHKENVRRSLAWWGTISSAADCRMWFVFHSLILVFALFKKSEKVYLYFQVKPQKQTKRETILPRDLSKTLPANQNFLLHYHTSRSPFLLSHQSHQSLHSNSHFFFLFKETTTFL